MGKRKIGNLWEVIDLKQKETFLCIDLKSFYASVECVERGLDPFTTNLVVADPDRSVSTICLAITPAMKSWGSVTVAGSMRYRIISNILWQNRGCSSIWSIRQGYTGFI